ncbi:M23 family metallopeptidase [Arthrobacter sp. MYb213]|uniref:M23 family metallopeptidase n=1 Tax=Arthrobacter sp. MYb213 TaxID=1848595 RepID=UPI000CFB261F|nr:M23 family metallopeptidase [Arthrobacter sp. MYb213]PRB72669.1 hypothetical protein CQ011_03250 [Arthrobacter sp. MYb213]
MVWTTSVVSAIGLTGALAWPIFAQPADLRSGTLATTLGSLENSSFENYPVVVSEFAPLAVFGGSGKALAIDGRPEDMPLVVWNLDGEQANDAQQVTNSLKAPQNSKVPAERALLVGTVASKGQLPGALQLMHPVTTRRISSPYGWRANPTGAGNQIHIGQDYPIVCGSPVYASEAGTISVSRWAGHSGMRVTIDHGHNVQTGYSHNSKLLVKVGQRVRQGEVIALSGTTGNSTGCHVHFEVLISGRWHDPRLYLPMNPGQRRALIDSSKLTVDADSAPKSKETGTSKEDKRQSRDSQKEKNPDVIVPKDDTPVVPTPEPEKKPKPKPKPSPTPEPSESESATPSKSPSVRPTAKPEPSKSPTDKPTVKPSPTPSETKKPTPSQQPSESASPTKQPSKSPDVTQTPKPTPTASDSPTPKPKEKEPIVVSPKPSESVKSSAAPPLSESPEVTKEPRVMPSETVRLPNVEGPTVRATQLPEESNRPNSSASQIDAESQK